MIAKPDDDRPLVGQVDGYTDASARQAVERLEHIERWKTTAELNNPATSIGPGRAAGRDPPGREAADQVGVPRAVHQG